MSSITRSNGLQASSSSSATPPSLSRGESGKSIAEILVAIKNSSSSSSSSATLPQPGKKRSRAEQAKDAAADSSPLPSKKRSMKNAWDDAFALPIARDLWKNGIRCGCGANAHNEPGCKKTLDTKLVEEGVKDDKMVLEKYIQASPGKPARRMKTLLAKLDDCFGLPRERKGSKTYKVAKKIIEICKEHKLCASCRGTSSCKSDKSCQPFTYESLRKSLSPSNSASLAPDECSFLLRSSRQTRGAVAKQVNRGLGRENPSRFKRRFLKAIASQ